MYPSDGRKEEDELSLWYSTESLCVTLFRVERKRVATLSHWLLSQWKGNRVSSVPLWMQPKRPKHIKMALCVHWPSLVANAASKAPFKGLTGTFFLELPPLRIGVRLSTEAMWQMINFSGRLEARGSGRGVLCRAGQKVWRDPKEYKSPLERVQVHSLFYFMKTTSKTKETETYNLNI